MLLTLKKTIVYGPVHSRRLGISLGLNIVPSQYKLCTFNCLYCHYGFNKYLTNNFSGFSKDFPSPMDVERDLEEYLIENKQIDFITFSGNGEPCSHPEFEEIVHRVLSIRDKYVPGIKVSILSNSSMLEMKSVRDALLKLDLRIMKFDCGKENTFKRFNRPYKEISFKQVFKNLKNMKNIVIQTCLASGDGGNFSHKDVEAWKQKISEIAPLYVQLYSLDREPALDSLKKVGTDKLIEIKNDLEKNYKIRVELY